MILMRRWKTSSYCWAIGRTLACTRRLSGSSWQKTQGSSLWQLHQLVARVIYNTRQLWALDPVLYMFLMLLTKDVDTKTVCLCVCHVQSWVQWGLTAERETEAFLQDWRGHFSCSERYFQINLINLSNIQDNIFNLQFTMFKISYKGTVAETATGKSCFNEDVTCSGRWHHQVDYGPFYLNRRVRLHVTLLYLVYTFHLFFLALW